MAIDMIARTRTFALDIIRLYSGLPRTVIAQTIGKQILRSGTSVGAHYREAYRSRSNAELVSKFEGGLQELEETRYWIELLIESGVVLPDRAEALLKEVDELTAIFVTCVRNVKRKAETKRRDLSHE